MLLPTRDHYVVANLARIRIRMQNYFRNATNVRPIMIQNFLMSQQHHIHVKNYQFLDREFSGIL